MFYDIDGRVADIVETFIDQECKPGNRDNTGLDPRAFQGKFYFNRDCIVVTAGMNRSLRYYGGFEYIDDDFIRQYGDYVIYSSHEQRVQEVIDNLLEDEMAEEDKEIANA